VISCLQTNEKISVAFSQKTTGTLLKQSFNEHLLQVIPELKTAGHYKESLNLMTRSI
jgi:hypothetical protein